MHGPAQGKCRRALCTLPSWYNHHMGRCNHSDELKATVLAAIDAGVPIIRAAEQAGVPYSTAQDWSQGYGLSPAVPFLRQAKREDLSELFEREARAALGSADGKRDSAAYRDLMVGAGIATDKMQLLRGAPTAIHARADDPETRRALLRDLLLDAIQARATEPDTQTSVPRGTLDTREGEGHTPGEGEGTG